jgi:hypothetical protein
VLGKYLQNKKQRLAAGASAGVIVLGGVGLALIAGGSHAAPPTTTTTSTTTTVPPTTTTTAPPRLAPLTGLPDALADHPAVFVKIDNAPQARPHAGINQADILFEERVEGNITRLAAVFHSQAADTVGPVRSTRTTDVGLVAMFGRPIFASSGANNGVLQYLRQHNVFDVGHNTGGGGFWREGGRRAPHNLMTSTVHLYQKAGADQPPPPPSLFQYRAEGEKLAAGALKTNGIALSYGGPEISRFSWRADVGLFLRTHAGEPHLDTSGVPVAPANVVVLEIGYDFSGANGQSRPHGVSTGEGRAWVLTAGHIIEGRWVRPTLGDPLQLLASDGNPIKLTPGQTFVALPPHGGAVSF